MNPYEKLDALFARARKILDSMTPDQLAHQRHAQRASFAFGNVALSYDAPSEAFLAQLLAYCEQAAGPCPCSPCRNGADTSGIRGRAACQTARSGVMLVGEIDAV